MENNNLPIEEPIAAPAVEPIEVEPIEVEPIVVEPVAVESIAVEPVAETLTEEILTAEPELTVGNLSEPVLTEAADFSAPEAAPVQSEDRSYTPPVVELPTLDASASAPVYQQPQVVYVQQPVYQQNPQQPVYSQQPVYVQQPIYVQQPQKSTKGRGASIAALVLGIVSIVSCLFIVFGFIAALCGFLGLIFAIVALAKKRNGAMTIIGLIFSILGLLIGGLLSVACVAAYEESYDYYDDYYYYDYDYGYDYDEDFFA